jgi:GNAT superfamily N-acetyltransferase
MILSCGSSKRFRMVVMTTLRCIDCLRLRRIKMFGSSMVIIRYRDCPAEVKATATRHVFNEFRSEFEAEGLDSESCCNDRFRTFEDNKGAVYVAVSRREFQGVVAVRAGNWAEICYLYVVPEKRGRGIATSLLEHAVRNALPDFGIILIACDEDMVHFYSNRGFVMYDKSARLASGRQVNAMIYRTLRPL